MTDHNDGADFDYVVIGSGFGGSVAALRLSEKGYRVAVLEMGKRIRPEDMPSSNHDAGRYVWAPKLGMKGLMRFSVLKHALVATGVGVGGGSLVYAAASMMPPDHVWKDPAWVGLENWYDVMPPHYATARRMLGVTPNPELGTADRLLQMAANENGYSESFKKTESAIYFGPEQRSPDPFFEGKGPARSGCVKCGGCLIGCKHGAKNSLDMNYLHIAEQNGVQIIPETRVDDIVPLGEKKDGSQGYVIHTSDSLKTLGGEQKTLRTRGVVVAAGVLGTLKLLFSAREKGSLPGLSERLGEVVRTNAESIAAFRMDDDQADVTDGIALGSRMHIGEDIHVEAFRYPPGSDAMSYVSTLMAYGDKGLRRIFAWLGEIFRHPRRFLRTFSRKDWAKQTVFLLGMQNADTRIQLRWKRPRWFSLRKRLVSEGPRIPAQIGAFSSFVKRAAAQLGATPLSSLTEILLGVPTTAHILGGCGMGRDAKEGVIDSRGRVHGYRNMYICDGSAIGANLTVNPSLTITALAEHMMSHVETREESPADDHESKVA